MECFCRWYPVDVNELVKTNLQRTRDISKMTAVKDIIGDGAKPLSAFDDDLFEAMVKKVVIKSQTDFEFHFESWQIIKAKTEKQKLN